MLNTTLELDEIEPGDYGLTFTMHDVNDPHRTTKVAQRFTIVGSKQSRSNRFA